VMCFCFLFSGGVGGVGQGDDVVLSWGRPIILKKAKFLII